MRGLQVQPLDVVDTIVQGAKVADDRDTALVGQQLLLSRIQSAQAKAVDVELRSGSSDEIKRNRQGLCRVVCGGHDVQQVWPGGKTTFVASSHGRIHPQRLPARKLFATLLADRGLDGFEEQPRALFWDPWTPMLQQSLELLTTSANIRLCWAQQYIAILFLGVAFALRLR